MKIVFLDSTALPPHLPIPRPNFPHEWVEYESTAPDEVLKRAKDAEIIITSKVVLNRDIMSRLPRLKLIALTATGTNNIDLATAKELGIVVKNVAGYSSVSVPEHVIGLIFSLKHSLAGWYRDQQAGKWGESKQFCYFDHPITDIRGSTLGIIGKGSLGSEVARLATALGMKVLFAERRGAVACRAGYTPFEAVLNQADIVSLHCPLTEDSRNLINQQTLSLFKRGALLINAGRGPLVDETALLAALKSGRLGGAAIDVMATEPPAKDNPLLLAAQSMTNLLITPHVAWASDSAVTILVNKVRSNIEEFVATGK
ncbi:2-hydroxyacid dehydrogenase [Pasteurellaceae bacterium LIM206]|nr:2-hydroxyacid dehydrogenase [Pasteurellaceae bacterium LIM206]